MASLYNYNGYRAPELPTISNNEYAFLYYPNGADGIFLSICTGTPYIHDKGGIYVNTTKEACRVRQYLYYYNGYAAADSNRSVTAWTLLSDQTHEPTSGVNTIANVVSAGWESSIVWANKLIDGVVVSTNDPTHAGTVGAITGISINAPDNVSSGEICEISVSVTGTEIFVTDAAACSISGATDSTLTRQDGTNVFTLEVGMSETSEVIVISAHSAQDPSVSVTKEITVLPVILTGFNAEIPDTIASGVTFHIPYTMEGTNVSTGGAFGAVATSDFSVMYGLSESTESPLTLVAEIPEGVTSAAVMLMSMYDQTGEFMIVKDVTVVDSDSIAPSVTIDCANAVNVGSNIPVRVFVTGVLLDGVSSTCSISGNNSADTKILDTETDGLFRLWVGANETASSVTITALSNTSPVAQATKSITITKSDTGGDGGDNGGGTEGGGDSGGGGDNGGTGGGTGGGTEGGDSGESDKIATAADLKAAFWSGFASGVAMYGRRG